MFVDSFIRRSHETFRLALGRAGVRKKTLAAATVALISAVPVQAARVEIILDVSGSMRAQMGGETRMDAARKAIRATMAGIQPDSIVALRLYGHRVSQDKKAESCKDSELAVPFQPVDKPAFQAIVDRATPRGQTPLTHSLELAAQDFGPASDEERVIILVSDGEESCGGNPEAAARNLLAQGFKLKVHTIGFDVDVAARAQLEAISKVTGGEYHDARSAAALADSLTRLAQKGLVIDKKEESLGQAIRGGDGYESAVEIKPGQLYHLDHHQKAGQYDYFYVSVKGGEKITASVETGQKGVSISGDSARETDFPGPCAGMTLQDNARGKLGEVGIYASRGEKKGLQGTLGPSQGGRLYVLVGYPTHDQHMDGRFQVDLKQQAGDAGSSRDAGAAEPGALAVKPGTHQARLDWDADDKADVFKFTADPQATYHVVLRPANPQAWLTLSVADANALVKSKTEWARGEPARVGDLKFPRGGEVFVRVGYHENAKLVVLGAGNVPIDSDYTLELKQEGASEPAAEAPQSFGDRVRAFFAKVLYVAKWTAIFGGVFLAGGLGGYLLGRRRR